MQFLSEHWPALVSGLIVGLFGHYPYRAVLRDRFAAKAMQAITQGPAMLNGSTEKDPTTVAIVSYQIADMMMSVRKMPKK